MIDRTKIAELHEYFQSGGSKKAADVSEFLGGADKPTVKEYTDELKRIHPDVYIKNSEADNKSTEPQYTVVLVDSETGLGEELEITGIKGTKIYTKRKIPTELVTVKIGGQDVEVDILRLRKMKSTEQLHGVSAQTLLLLAQIAKGS